MKCGTKHTVVIPNLMKQKVLSEIETGDQKHHRKTTKGNAVRTEFRKKKTRKEKIHIYRYKVKHKKNQGNNITN